MSAVDRLLATDETFADVADLLFGSGGDALYQSVIAKANHDGADLSTKKKRERTQARIGLATNVIGLGAGAAATPGAFKAAKTKVNRARGIKETDDLSSARRFVRGARKTSVGRGSLKALKTLRKPKVAAGLAVGGAALQTANLGGDFVANRVLNRAAKKNPDVRGGAQTLARAGTKKIDDKFGKRTSPSEFGKRFKPVEIEKSAPEVIWEGEFSKFDEDKHLVFGWASIVKKDGEDVVDLQGDYIDIDEIEKSAYNYVIKSRKGGNQHQRVGDEPLHVSDMVESFIVTPDKIEKMGLPEDTPLGWWVGYKVNDEDTWQDVKSGRRTGFSIHGRGTRKALD